MKKLFGLIAKLISKVHMPFNHKAITEAECFRILLLLKDGDVLLTHTKGELSNIFLDHWSHAGVFCNGKIYEATTECVKRTHPMFFLSRKDDVVILRPKRELNAPSMNYFLEENIGDAYDFEFEADDGQFYCFELVAEALKSSSEIRLAMIKTPIGVQYLAKSFQTNEFNIIWRQ